VAVE
jgi:excisionase family DNA binding protein